MTEIIVPARVHQEKSESVVEKTAGKETDEYLIDASIELTESGE